MLNKQCLLSPTDMSQMHARCIKKNFNYNIRLAEQNLNSNSKCLEVLRSHNEYECILL